MVKQLTIPHWTFNGYLILFVPSNLGMKIFRFLVASSSTQCLTNVQRCTVKLFTIQHWMFNGCFILFVPSNLGMKTFRFLLVVQPNVLSDAHGASAVWVNHPALLGKTFHIYYQVYMTYPIEYRWGTRRTTKSGMWILPAFLISVYLSAPRGWTERTCINLIVANDYVAVGSCPPVSDVTFCGWATKMQNYATGNRLSTRGMLLESSPKAL